MQRESMAVGLERRSVAVGMDHSALAPSRPAGRHRGCRGASVTEVGVTDVQFFAGSRPRSGRRYAGRSASNRSQICWTFGLDLAPRWLAVRLFSTGAEGGRGGSDRWVDV